MFLLQAVRIPKFDYRLSSSLDTELQKLRCRVNYHALKFVDPILKMGKELVQRMRMKSKHYIALHLRFVFTASLCLNILLLLLFPSDVGFWISGSVLINTNHFLKLSGAQLLQLLRYVIEFVTTIHNRVLHIYMHVKMEEDEMELRASDGFIIY